MRSTGIAFVIAFVLCACSSTPTSPRPPADVSGTWNRTGCEGVSTGCKITMIITQSGSSLSGSFTWDGVSGPGSIAGSVADSTVSASLIMRDQPDCALRLTATVGATNCQGRWGTSAPAPSRSRIRVCRLPTSFAPDEADASIRRKPPFLRRAVAFFEDARIPADDGVAPALRVASDYNVLSCAVPVRRDRYTCGDTSGSTALAIGGFGRIRRFFRRGGMAEWSMAVVLKTTVPGRVPGVRIPLPPPDSSRESDVGSAVCFCRASSAC